MPDLFAPENLLASCLGMQEVVASVPPDERDRAGADAQDVLMSGDVNYYGAKKLEVRTLGAYGMPDGLTWESDTWPVVMYGEMRLMGTLARISYMRVHRVSSLAWMIVDPLVREDYGDTTAPQTEAEKNASREDYLPLELNRRLARPLYLPVGMIESALVAA
jgi:hypothetical protein